MKNNRHYTDALFEEFDFFNDEFDSLLTEDLDTMLKYYNNLQNWDKQELLNFLAKDPTWNSSKEQGQYSKWILDKLSRNLLNSSHLGHLHDALKRFEDNKKYLKNKDINKFKTLQDIDAYLNDDNSYNELSHSQKVRQHRRDKQNVDLGNEAELIYDDPDWEIWIPKTYAASCKLGQGSRWCTASTETSEYFDDYSSEGNLYIILNKNNKKEKYQFHLESESYMDIDDEAVDLFNLIEKEDNKKWVSALRQYDKNFEDICAYLISNLKEIHEKFKEFSQKINSLESIKYPEQKDIIKDYKYHISDRDAYNSLSQKDLSKMKNIKLEIANSVEKIEPYAFNNISWINQVIFEENSKLKSIGDSAFSYCKNITEINLPDSITEIDKWVFKNCSNLENIKLSNNLSNINYFTFAYCKKLKNIIIPNSVKSIGDYAFAGCSSLTNITIPEGVISIGEDAFTNCTSLESIEIPNSVTSIAFGAFFGCSNLTSITLPSSVTSIGENAFYGCKNLKNVYYNGTIEDWMNIQSEGYESTPMHYAEHFYMLNKNNEYYEVKELVIPKTAMKGNTYQLHGFDNIKFEK